MYLQCVIVAKLSAITTESAKSPDCCPSEELSNIVTRLVQHGVNKPPIPNQQNSYAVFILTFDF
jgi:hypothetical protein